MISASMLAFSVSGSFVMQVRTADPHPSPNSKSAVASISMKTGATLGTQAFTFPTRNEKANAEWKITTSRVTRPAAGIMMDRSPLPCLRSSLQGVTKDHDGLGFLLSLSVKLLSQLAEPCVSVTQILWMIHGEIAELSKKLITFSHRMYSADLTFEDNRMSLDLLKHCSVQLSQEVENRLVGPLLPAMDHRMDIPTDSPGLSSSNTSFRRSFATYLSAHSGPFFISNTPSPAISPPPTKVEGVTLIPFLSLYSNLKTYFRTAVQPLAVAWLLLPRGYVSRTGFNPFS